MPPEEMNPNSLSDDELRHRSILESWAQTQELTDLDVFDANGQRLGRVRKCFVDDGRLIGCEVHLDHTLQRLLDVNAHTATIKPEQVTAVSASGIHIAKAAAQIVPDAKPIDRHVEGEDRRRGSDTFPRKTR